MAEGREEYLVAASRGDQPGDFCLVTHFASHSRGAYLCRLWRGLYWGRYFMAVASRRNPSYRLGFARRYSGHVRDGHYHVFTQAFITKWIPVADTMRFFKFLWALPTTSIGVIAGGVWLLSGAKMRIANGVLEVYGGKVAYWMMRRGFAAMTLGHVILGFSAPKLEQLRPHEHVHVRQAERWGILFIPAYLLAGLWQGARGRHIYYDNPFEQEAFAVDAMLAKRQAENKKAP
jgi:hypothetical protein